MKLISDPIWLKWFSDNQQRLANEYQSKAAYHQKAADSARKMVKQLKREQKGEENVSS